MPLRLLWQKRNPREVDVPILLEIVDYDKRWEMMSPFKRWVIMEMRRFVWRRERRGDD